MYDRKRALSSWGHLLQVLKFVRRVFLPPLAREERLFDAYPLQLYEEKREGEKKEGSKGEAS